MSYTLEAYMRTAQGTWPLAVSCSACQTCPWDSCNFESNLMCVGRRIFAELKDDMLMQPTRLWCTWVCVLTFEDSLRRGMLMWMQNALALHKGALRARYVKASILIFLAGSMLLGALSPLANSSFVAWLSRTGTICIGGRHWLCCYGHQIASYLWEAALSPRLVLCYFNQVLLDK